MSAIIIDGRKVAKQIHEKLAKEVAKTGNHPCLSVCLVGDDENSAIYVRNKSKACAAVGITSDVIRFPANVKQSELIGVINDLNNSSCSGILIQLPLPIHLDRLTILNSVNVYKDVDGFHSDNLGRLAQGQPRFVPCTPAGVLALLRCYQIPLHGRHCVIINNTIVVGRPLALLLQNEGATVTICDINTNNLQEICLSADILVSAVGKQPFRVGVDLVREGAVVIDIGISRIKGQVVGDVDFDEVSRKASYLTPCPGGVGPMTVAMLLKNTVEAAKYKETNEFTEVICA